MHEHFISQRLTNSGLSLLVKCLLLCILLMTLSGCSLTDGFGSRAGNYNGQVADAKSGSILANIMRAAYSQPLQFSDVTTVTGQGSAGGSIAAVLPFAGSGPRAARLFSVSPSLAANASSSFNVANLNTQEFYYGIQTPISPQLIFSFLRSGFNPYVILPLVISEIEVENAGLRSVIRNRADSPQTFFAFYSALKSLIENGLSAEPTKPRAVGPVLTSEQAANPKLLAALFTATANDAPTLREISPGRFQLERKASSYRFCFDPLRAKGRRPYNNIDFVIGETALQAQDAPIVLGYDNDVPIPSLTLKMAVSDYCGTIGRREPQPNDGNIQPVANLRVSTRSVEGIFTFLGEMVRTELGLGVVGPRSLAIRPSRESSFYLFTMEREPTGSNNMTTIHDSKSYGIRLDPSGSHDASSQVLQLLTALLALQSSAKSLPAPNVITVLGP